MENSGNNSNEIKRIAVSRNHPSAFVVGAGNFIAARVINKLLESKTQVLAFDRLNAKSRRNLAEDFRYKHFYFFGIEGEGFAREVLDVMEGDLPSVGYSFLFIGQETTPSEVKGFINLASKFSRAEKSSGGRVMKCVLVSDIRLYKKNLSPELRHLKTLEVMFAKGVEANKLNGRIVRLGSVFGPGMEWEQDDVIVELLRARLRGDLDSGRVVEEQGSRAIYLDRAVELVMKSVLNGSTAMKIYDGALVRPVKSDEIKRYLIEGGGVKFELLPDWLTPNLERTVRELNWSPESDVARSIDTTLEYFGKYPDLVSGDNEQKSDKSERKVEEKVVVKPEKSFWEETVQEAETNVSNNIDKGSGNWGRKLGYLIMLAVIGYGLLYPLAVFGAGVVRIGLNLTESQIALREGNYKNSVDSANRAVEAITGIKSGYKAVETIGKMGVASQQIENGSKLIDSLDEAIVAIRDASLGFESLSEVTAVISGENQKDPASVYRQANISLKSARESLTKVSIDLTNRTNEGWIIFGDKLRSLQTMILDYNLAVSKGEVATMILPGMTGVGNGSKSYLVILQNNKNLRASGGIVEAVARVDFDNGRLVNIESTSSEDLDNLTTSLPAPDEIRRDLSATAWSISESSWEPDFAANSQIIESMYQRVKGKKVDGVIGVNLSALSGLIEGLNGVNVNNNQVRIEGGQLDANFYAKVTDSKVYSELLNEVLKKMFFLEEVNWSELGVVINSGLEHKDIQLFINDKSSFAYINSQNWGGIMLRQGELATGMENDFLNINDTVIATGSANVNISKKIKTTTMIGEDLGLSHKLEIGYQVVNIDKSVTSVKDRLRIYVPGGNKLDKVTINGNDATKDFVTLSDFGRIVFSSLVTMKVGEVTTIEINYSSGVVKLDDNKLDYRMDIQKQAGAIDSELEWMLEFPKEWKVADAPVRALTSSGSVTMKDLLDKDLTIGLRLVRP